MGNLAFAMIAQSRNNRLKDKKRLECTIPSVVLKLKI